MGCMRKRKVNLRRDKKVIRKDILIFMEESLPPIKEEVLKDCFEVMDEIILSIIFIF
jgi:hypothetical protein